MELMLRAAVAALALLGMLGGCLVIAGSGFTTSNKRGGWEVFVPVPEAYVMAGIMFALSVLACIWLLRRLALGLMAQSLSVAIYIGAAAALTGVLRKVLW